MHELDHSETESFLTVFNLNTKLFYILWVYYQLSYSSNFSYKFTVQFTECVSQSYHK